MKFKLAGTAALILAATVSFAAGDPFDKYAANLVILQDRAVQNELKVTDAQRATLNKHAKWVEGEEKKLRAKVDPKKGATAEQQKQMMTLVNTFKDKICAVLSATQLKRLREVSLQSMGHRALLDEQVAKKVGLSQVQLKKLRTAFDGMAKKINDAQVAAYKPINDKYAKKPEPKTDAEKKKLRDAYIKEIQAADKKLAPTINNLTASYKATLDATLLADQKKKWSALQGTPFKPK